MKKPSTEYLPIEKVMKKTADKPIVKSKHRLRKESSRIRKTFFKPDIRTASAVVSAVAFLQKTGFPATPKNIRSCVLQRSKHPHWHLGRKLSNYLSKGLELGILKRNRGTYRIGNFDFKNKKSKKVLKSKNQQRKQLKQTNPMSEIRYECSERPTCEPVNVAPVNNS